MRGRAARGLGMACLLAVSFGAPALWLSCSTNPGAKGSIMPADLSCASDQDCTIRQAEFGCCCDCGTGCPSSTAPFAISKRANTAWDAYCDGQECTMLGCSHPSRSQTEALYAVCAGHICELRSKQ